MLIWQPVAKAAIRPGVGKPGCSAGGVSAESTSSNALVSIELGGAWIEQSLAGHVIYFNPDSVGILEQHRIISRRPWAVFRRMDDLRTGFLQEPEDLVYVAALACSQAYVMEPDSALYEAPAAVFRFGRYNSDRGASADVVVKLLALHHRLQPQERHQLLVEGDADLEVVHGQYDVRDAVDFHHFTIMAALGCTCPRI